MGNGYKWKKAKSHLKSYVSLHYIFGSIYSKCNSHNGVGPKSSLSSEREQQACTWKLNFSLTKKHTSKHTNFKQCLSGIVLLESKLKQLGVYIYIHMYILCESMNIRLIVWIFSFPLQLHCSCTVCQQWITKKALLSLSLCLSSISFWHWCTYALWTSVCGLLGTYVLESLFYFFSCLA